MSEALEKCGEGPGLIGAWNDAVLAWLRLLAEALGHPYDVRERDGIAFLSGLPPDDASDLLVFVRRAMGSIRAALGGLCDASDEWVRVVMLFNDLDRYHDYVCHYDAEEGHWATSGGSLIRTGYLHVVGLAEPRWALRSSLTHELTHLLLVDRGLPLWLEEAFTQLMEERVTGTSDFKVDREVMARHRGYWARHGLTGFWSGESFSNPDDGQELSYHLSQTLVRPLLADSPRQFLAFASAARWEDCGAAAAKEHLGMALGELAARCLGPGDWEPVVAS